MADRQLRLLVGAAIDASFGQVMQSVVEAAKRARRQIAAEMTAGAKDGAKAQKVAAQETVAAIGTTAVAAKSAKEQADAMAADVLRKAKSNAREKVAIEKSAMAETESDLRRHNAKRIAAAREAAKEEEKANRSKGSPQGLSRGGALLMRAGGAAIGMGTRMVGSVMQGMGVDTTLQGQLHSASSRQSLAIDVSSQGYIGSGKGPTGSGTYVDPNEIMNQARSVGNETGTDTKDVLEGMERFVKMTGDLKTARDSMSEIGKIAKANGADMGDMMEAAANISISMGEIPDKGKHLGEIMRTIAGQGHLGAVTIKDMAASMGRLTAQANFFKLDPMSAATLTNAGVTDPTGQRIAVMGAMTQWARAKGGRVTARQATQSSMAFIRDMSSASQVKRMAGQGINVYADAGHTQVRDPLQMFLEVTKKARVNGGLNRDVLNNVFGKQQSRAVADAMAQDYNAAYKKAAESGITDETMRHQKAMESLTETFQNYLRVTQSGQEVTMKFNAAMAKTESQANIMNNQLGKAADELLHALLPAVQALTPALVSASQGFADWFANITGSKDKKSFDDAAKTDMSSTNALSLVNQVVETASTSREVVNMAGPGMTTEVGHSTITTAQEKEARLALTSLRAEVAKRQAFVSKEGEGRRGPIPGVGEHYKNLSDEQLNKEAQGDAFAAQYKQDKIQLDMLKGTLEKLSTAIDKLDVLKDMGRVQEVAIVADHTSPPGGGASPQTSGTADVDSSGTENSSHL